MQSGRQAATWEYSLPFFPGAFRVIACDRTVDDGLRSSAAEQLPDLDPQAAAEAFRVIACDGTVDDGLRSSAAEQLARLDPRAVARARATARGPNARG